LLMRGRPRRTCGPQCSLNLQRRSAPSRCAVFAAPHFFCHLWLQSSLRLQICASHLFIGQACIVHRQHGRCTTPR
jgi:hypothetical protein